MGLASGTDTLAPGASRGVRKSALVRRANQCAWRSASGSLMMDEHSYQECPMKYSAVRVPAEIDGHNVYRVVLGNVTQESEQFDNEPLKKFLTTITDAGIEMLKYNTSRVDTSAMSNTGWGKPVEMLQLTMEAYEARTARNLTYSEKIAISDFPDRMEAIKHILSQMGLAIMRYEVSMEAGAYETPFTGKDNT